MAILMGCAVLPHLKALVDIVESGLDDEQQKVFFLISKVSGIDANRFRSELSLLSAWQLSPKLHLHTELKLSIQC